MRRRRYQESLKLDRSWTLGTLQVSKSFRTPGDVRTRLKTRRPNRESGVRRVGTKDSFKTGKKPVVTLVYKHESVHWMNVKWYFRLRLLPLSSEGMTKVTRYD